MRNPEKNYHQKFAVNLFNYTWKFLEKKRKTKEEGLMMKIHAAHASRFHWGGAGTPVRDLFFCDLETVSGYK